MMMWYKWIHVARGLFHRCDAGRLQLSLPKTHTTHAKATVSLFWVGVNLNTGYTQNKAHMKMTPATQLHTYNS